jgi:4-amino-4-deoxy-L-arabinose transferase-like glycosyltransferase
MEPNLRTADRSQAVGGLALLTLVTTLLLLMRLWLDGHLELMFDEAYYALWARHLAWCYLDHPPMVAVWIRLSTLLFGNHEFGIRALGTLAASAGGGLVYLLSWHLFGRRAEAAFAGLIYSSMLLIAAGAVIITPDTPLLFFWSIACYALVLLYRSGDWRWWLLIGAAMGLALQSKYTALLLGGGIACAMLVVPPMRRWWRHPAPYVAGALTFAIFIPVIEWNYQHGWASFAKQFDRAQGLHFSLRYVGELLGSQFGLLTPFVFILTAGGACMAFRRPTDRSSEASLLLVSLIGPLLVYFLFHSLHARVQGNWVAPAYPLLAVLAARGAFQLSKFNHRWRPTMALSRRWAIPVGIGIAVLAYLQAEAGFFPLDPAKDPTALMVGWSDLTRQVEYVARREKASYVLTSGYALTSLLSVYASGERPIFQFNERLRWASFENPDASDLSHVGLYVSDADKDLSAELVDRFVEVRRIGSVDRSRGGKVIRQYVIYRLTEPVKSVLDGIGTDPSLWRGVPRPQARRPLTAQVGLGYEHAVPRQ